jgi:hypothetical protein
VPEPTAAEFQALLQTITKCIGRRLGRKGVLIRDEDNSHLASESDGEAADVFKDLQGHSIKQRIALGPHKGRPAFKLQALPPLTGDRAGERLAQAGGFSPHAGVAASDIRQRRSPLRRANAPSIYGSRMTLLPGGTFA